MRDTSLRMGPGDHGTVVEVRVFNRHGIEKDERALQNERHEIERLSRDRDDGLEILERNIYSRLNDLLIGKKINDGPKGSEKGSKINQDMLDSLSKGLWWKFSLESESDAKKMEALHDQFEKQKKIANDSYQDKVE